MNEKSHRQNQCDRSIEAKLCEMCGAKCVDSRREREKKEVSKLDQIKWTSNCIL